MYPTATALRLPWGTSSVCALSFGRALVLSRPKKPHWGFFPRSFMPTAPAAAGVSGSAPAPRLGRGGTPHSLRLLLRARPSLGKGCASARFLAPLPCRSLARHSPLPREPPRRQPFLPFSLRGGGFSRSPLRGLPLGGVRSTPPAVLFRRAVGGAVFCVSRRWVFRFCFSRAAAQGSPPPARL